MIRLSPPEMIAEALDRVARWEQLLNDYIAASDFRYTHLLIRWINRENEWIKAERKSFLEAQDRFYFPTQP